MNPSGKRTDAWRTNQGNEGGRLRGRSSVEGQRSRGRSYGDSRPAWGDGANFNLRDDSREWERRKARFGNNQSLQRSQTPNSGWSATVWNKTASPNQAQIVDKKSLESDSRNGSKIIGLGRATGLSRVPDTVLSNSPGLIRKSLVDLLGRSKRLEVEKLTAIELCGAEEQAESSKAALEEWESILASFRQLTMAVTASSLNEVKHLAISIYEGAADACLLAGNLSFYLSCQSRLLSELYCDGSADSVIAKRRDEFIGYSLLYFGVFCTDALELAMIMRRMSSCTLALPEIKFSLSVLTAFRNDESMKFISLFNQCNTRQKTILKTSLEAIRKTALAEIVRAYLALEKSFAISWLGMKSEKEFLQLLEHERPDLKSANSKESAEFHFRLARTI